MSNLDDIRYRLKQLDLLIERYSKIAMGEREMHHEWNAQECELVLSLLRDEYQRLYQESKLWDKVKLLDIGRAKGTSEV